LDEKATSSSRAQMVPPAVCSPAGGPVRSSLTGRIGPRISHAVDRERERHVEEVVRTEVRRDAPLDAVPGVEQIALDQEAWQALMRRRCRRRWRDGTSAIVFEPLDFLARLAALVPRPRATC